MDGEKKCCYNLPMCFMLHISSKACINQIAENNTSMNISFYSLIHIHIKKNISSK